MIMPATEVEKQFIISRAAVTAKESMGSTVDISQEKAEGLLQAALYSGASLHVTRGPDGELAGWILLGKQMDFITGKQVGFMFELYVLPPYRKKGLGKLLIQEGVGILKSRGYEEVRFNVYTANPVKEMYSRLGFKELQTIMYI
ncbi:GNAT family N-acetyltransferase [Evansella sp. LMS18]|jgi:ribosomal protein S18 acetylase RimI-like enzyme|uniref:GNAT family N-acetyltransferase n=1 Tax=Evansella sp. LMS18 TaxID=2924033 RepID=UPI0020CFE90F|nr:GNAT family N-acetyltransferase [Evansella sp. LMS18]UTR10414.1 GNAT family N-acetyltransferase [Evansella sp. LMS18]